MFISRIRSFNRANGTSAIALALLVSLPALTAFAGSLQLGSPVRKGTDVTVPIVLQGDVGPGVAAMDFKLVYDPAVFQPVSIVGGNAALSAHKTVSSNLVAPGQYVVVLFGMNQAVMQPGEVASVSLKQIGQSQASESKVSVVQPTFSSLQGQEIQSEGSNSTIPLGSTPTPTPGDGGTTPTPQTPGNPPPVSTPTQQPPSGQPLSGGKIPRFTDTPPKATDPQDPAVNHLAGARPNTLAASGGVPASDQALAKLSAAAQELLRKRQGLVSPAAQGTSAPANAGGPPDSAQSGTTQIPALKPGQRPGPGQAPVIRHGSADGLKMAQLSPTTPASQSVAGAADGNAGGESGDSSGGLNRTTAAIIAAVAVVGILAGLMVRRRLDRPPN